MDRCRRGAGVFGFVLLFAFVLLLVSFRSLVIPVTAVLLNLLSVAAAAHAPSVQAGEHALRLDGNRAAELADWVVAPGSPRRDGIPPAAYPAEPAHTEPDFPGRDFAAGKGWGWPPPRESGLPGPYACWRPARTSRPTGWRPGRRVTKGPSRTRRPRR